MENSGTHKLELKTVDQVSYAVKDIDEVVEAWSSMYGIGPWSYVENGGADFDMYKAWAKRAAGIPGWEEHPELKDVRDFSDILMEKTPPADTSYNV